MLPIEQELADGRGDAYRRHLTENAIVVMPGAVLTRDACAAAMDDSPGLGRAQDRRRARDAADR